MSSTPLGSLAPNRVNLAAEHTTVIFILYLQEKKRVKEREDESDEGQGFSFGKKKGDTFGKMW